MNPDVGLSVSFYVSNLMVTIRAEVDLRSGVQIRWGLHDALAGQDHRFLRGRNHLSDSEGTGSILGLDDRFRRSEGAA